MVTAESKVANVEARIIEFLCHEVLAPGMTVDRDDELLANEILDSIAVVRLGAFVEQEFRFKMSPADFVIENFQSVAVLAQYVHGVTGQVGE